MMPAMDYQQWRRSQVLYARLPELYDRLRRVEKRLAPDSSGGSTPGGDQT
jgi:hypothetical protein